MATHVTADLHLDLDVDGEKVVHTHLTGHGGALRMVVDDPAVFAGRRDTAVIVSLAELMAARGLVVHVVSDQTHLVSLGAVLAPWWQRRRPAAVGSGSAAGGARGPPPGPGPTAEDLCCVGGNVAAHHAVAAGAHGRTEPARARHHP